MAELELSDDEVEYLEDVLSIWIDGYRDAKEETVTNPVIASMEELIELSGGLFEQEELAINIRRKLRDNDGT